MGHDYFFLLGFVSFSLLLLLSTNRGIGIRDPGRWRGGRRGMENKPHKEDKNCPLVSSLAPTERAGCAGTKEATMS
jgi:hypothetical protein